MRSPVEPITRSLENVGRSVEADPGFQQFERFLDEVLDAAAFGIALMWALRWWFVLTAVGIVVVGLE